MLRAGPVKGMVDARLREFSGFKKKQPSSWFSELCFCILTANSKAETALKIQAELGGKGFLSLSEGEIREAILRNKHRFHNNKAGFIIEARRHGNIKEAITKIVSEEGQTAARRWLVENIKGLGYKEASHFLRNTGHFNVAIIDRHIISVLVSHKLLHSRPADLSPKHYLAIENILRGIARLMRMSLAELDLYMWYMKTGKVLK